ncbi:MAG TPA: WHG domain-containing protein [Trueperaceae bacterium]|nr:WHG domain-containing protein [Trueperaceae bacterium]
MARPAGGRTLTRAAVVDAAAALVDERGPEGLTLAELAKRLGVRSPSLYNHVDGLEGLVRELRLRALSDLQQELARAAVGRSGRDALAALCRVYRAFVLEHPGLYGLTVRSTEVEDAEVRQAGAGVVEVVLAVLRGYGLEGDDAVHATRLLRSTLHGFAVLEATGGFGLELPVEESFELAVELLHLSLVTLAERAGGRARAGGR